MEMEMEEKLKLDEIMFEMKSLLAADQPIISSNCSYGYNNNNNNNNMIMNPSSSSNSDLVVAPPAKLLSFDQKNDDDDDELAATNYNNLATSSSQVINFSSGKNDDYYYNNHNKKGHHRTSTMTAGRTTLQARDHVEAERKRRGNLGQLFISLSKVVPGLKKLDKASLLEDAISHLKALQERVSVLERETSKKNTSSCTRREYLCYSSDKLETNDKNKNDGDVGAEIKARVSEKHVLIEIHCKKQKGLMSRVPSELEKMHLNVVDMTIMPFGTQPLLHITLLAEMQIEFRGTVKEIVDRLQTIFFNPNPA